MRIRGASSDLEEAGEEVDEYVKSTSKLRREIKALSGVDIMEADEQTFRSTYDILMDISEVWDNLNDVSRANLLELISGKRNATVIKSVISNVQDLKGAYLDASSAQGTVAKANAEYLDSIEGRMAQFSTTFEEFSNKTLNSEWLKGLIEGATGLMSVLTNIVNMGDGIVVKIAAVVAGLKILQALKIGKLLPSLPKVFNGRVSKSVNCWEVHNQHYNYKVA